MAITAYSGTVPQRSNQPTTFAANMDDWILWATNTAIPGINTAVAAFNFNSTNSTSTTSLTIGAGSQSLTVQASKSYVEGMTVRIASTASTSNWMQGEVTSYNSTTGALVVNVTHKAGSGTIASWTISLSTAIALPYLGTEKVVVHTGNGHGSTNTVIRRFTTTLTNSGTSITYADSAANGGSFTINTAGIYSINYSDDGATTSCTFGVSLGSAQLTTAFQSISESTKLFYAGGQMTGGSAVAMGSGIVTYLAASSVLRCHTDGTTMGTAASTRMSIERLF